VSVPQMPAMETFTRASFSLISGRGASSVITCRFLNRMAFMVFIGTSGYTLV
jgi:hypothetical protein